MGLPTLKSSTSPIPRYSHNLTTRVDWLQANLTAQPGFPNPLVSVNIYNTVTQTNVQLDWSDSGSFEYVTGVWWIDPNNVAVRRLNRLQNVRNDICSLANLQI